MTKMHRVVLYVKDINNPMTQEDIISELESMRHLEFVHVGDIKTVDIGEWHDEHELNYIDADHEKYFK